MAMEKGPYAKHHVTTRGVEIPCYFGPTGNCMPAPHILAIAAARYSKPMRAGGIVQRCGACEQLPWITDNLFIKTGQLKNDGKDEVL